MDYFEFSLLPNEIQLDILVHTDHIALVRLCRTSTQYRKICTGEYDYLWKILLFELINPIYNYRNIEEFNKVNKTKFKNWYETYSYFYGLRGDLKSGVIVESNRGNIEGVKYLVSLGTDIHDSNELALRLASEEGHLDVVKYLVSRGANVHVCTDGIQKYDALGFAAENGHLDVVKYLIEQSVNVNSNNDLAIRLAAKNGHLDVVKYLVSRGADIHVYSDDALRWAARNGHLEVINYLVSVGADIDNSGVLIEAAANGYLNVVSYLIDQGADIHLEDDAALRVSAREGHLDVFKYLEKKMMEH